jgi:multiphosphoryl transfer protein
VKSLRGTGASGGIGLGPAFVFQRHAQLHPALLRLIAGLTLSKRRAEKWVGVCGEMAGDPLAARLLVGLGVNEISMSPSRLPEVKAAIRSTSLSETRALAARAIACATAPEVRRLLEAPGASAAAHPVLGSA